jgi:mRNA interferase MazF
MMRKMKILKRFSEWMHLKETLHEMTHTPPLFKEGEIWWCSIGENVGIEVNGKSKDFTRPLLVFKKLSRDGFLGIPMSTQHKEGSWYVSVTQHGKEVTVLLSQLRVVSSNRLHAKLSELDDSDCVRVATAFAHLYLSSNKKFPPPLQAGSWDNPK